MYISGDIRGPGLLNLKRYQSKYSYIACRWSRVFQRERNLSRFTVMEVIQTKLSDSIETTKSGSKRILFKRGDIIQVGRHPLRVLNEVTSSLLISWDLFNL